jgi:hypothetical protein
MGMWLYDDAHDMEEFQLLRGEIKRLEKEYLDLRIQLRDTVAALRSAPDDEYLVAKVKYLNKRIKGIEKMGPRLGADHPLEIALFAPPHG